MATVRFKTYEIEFAQQCGRPSLQFKECSNRSKRIKTEEFSKSTPLDELAHATQMNLPMLHK